MSAPPVTIPSARRPCFRCCSAWWSPALRGWPACRSSTWPPAPRPTRRSSRRPAPRRPGTTLVTDEQTGGRGRLGRTWLSEPGRGSHLLGARCGRALAPAQGHLLALATGVAVAEVLEEGFGLQGQVTLKWPNDVLLGRQEGVRHPAGGLRRRGPHPLGGRRHRAQRQQRAARACSRSLPPEQGRGMAGPAAAGLPEGAPGASGTARATSGGASRAAHLLVDRVWTGPARYPAFWPSGAGATRSPAGRWKSSPGRTDRNWWPRARRPASGRRGSCWCGATAGTLLEVFAGDVSVTAPRRRVFDRGRRPWLDCGGGPTREGWSDEGVSTAGRSGPLRRGAEGRRSSSPASASWRPRPGCRCPSIPCPSPCRPWPCCSSAARWARPWASPPLPAISLWAPLGAPVFHGGLGGVLVLAGPTGGYLVGFIPAVFLMGWAARAGRPPGRARRVAPAAAVTAAAHPGRWARSWPARPSTRSASPGWPCSPAWAWSERWPWDSVPFLLGDAAQGGGGRGSRLPRRPGALAVEALPLLRGRPLMLRRGAAKGHGA